MQIDLDQVKQQFARLVAEDFGSQRMLDFVLRIWENADLSPDDAGWVLWNICDQYALARANDPIAQHKYQREFFELVKRNFPERAHWVVSDSTQGVSLLRGGFLDFWCECYQYANQTVPRVEATRHARLQSHKANAFSFWYIGEVTLMRLALQEMACLVEEDGDWIGHEWAMVTYTMQLFEYYCLAGETDRANESADELERLLADWREQLGDAEVVLSKSKLLFGSWQPAESFVDDFSPVLRLREAILIAAVSFARNCLRFPTAERLFRLWLGYEGNKLNAYTEVMFLRSCWGNGHSETEIRRMFGESNTNSSTGYVTHVAPELSDVIG